MNLISVLLRFRFIWLNLLFIGYLWLLQPAVLQRLVVSTESGYPDWLMGGLLLGIQVFEMIGLLLKRPMSAYYAQCYPNYGDKGGCVDSGNVALYILTPIFHLGFSAFLALMAFDLLGLGLSGETATALQCLGLLLFFVVIFKEAFFIVLMLSVGSSPGQTISPPSSQLDACLRHWIEPAAIVQITLKDAAKDVLGDLLLLAFSTLAYTALWEFIIASSPLHRRGAGLLAEYLGVSILFLTVYFATRATYLMQESTIQQSRAARILSWGSFLAVWLTALWMIPVR